MNSFKADKTQYHIKKSYLHHFPELKGRMGKYYPGILNWEEQGRFKLTDADDICRIRLILRVVDQTPGFDFFNEEFNGQSPEKVCEILGMSKNIPKEDSQISFNYEIIPINTFEEAKKIAGNESWCIVISEEIFNEYTKGGNKFYFLANKNWRKEACVPGLNFPYDKYGYSFIAVEVSADKEIVSITSRWNTSCENSNNFFLSSEKLKTLLGDRFMELFI